MFKIIYFTRNNKYPILDFFEKIPKKDVAKILRDIDLLEEFGLSLGMPYIKKMSGTKDIWELRIKQSTNNYRVFYFTMKPQQIILLNAFQKKTSRTPSKELNKAIEYMNEYLERSENHES
ncbi:MAG: type II toxin-antitoxin system RelE/ParE family toxin [Bacillota bacterium]|nr:type II toxin-antitoxin system RelE/ParE family toxin [Bacillota bacterium]